MTDPRVEKLARLLVEYSVSIKKGKMLGISGHACASPLLRECYRHAIRKGALVEVNVAIDGLAEIFYAEANSQQLAYASPFREFRMRKLGALINVWGDTNTRSLTNADPKKMAAFAAANKKIGQIFLDRAAKKELLWVGTQWPTNAAAQDAEMSLEEYENFVFKAGHLDDADPIATWKRISASQKALAAALNKCKQIRIEAPDTDITLGVGGRRWINCDGHENFPDGEVFTGPVETQVNGHIRFSFPAIHHGREVNGVFIEFKNGKVVKAQADKGEDFLRAMVAMDARSSYLGELAFGTNYNITRYTRNTLFDEKIGGTMHLALGSGYPETGSVNKSGLHWDMVCDTRKKAKVFADGNLLLENGRFVNKSFPHP
jgi:aminopeptidase